MNRFKIPKQKSFEKLANRLIRTASSGWKMCGFTGDQESILVLPEQERL